MAVLEKFEKQPADVQDFDADYTDYIEAMGETVGAAHTAVATAESGITVDSYTITNGIVKVWLSGGTDGETYKVTVTLTTAGSRVKEAEFRVKVKET